MATVLFMVQLLTIPPWAREWMTKPSGLILAYVWYQLCVVPTPAKTVKQRWTNLLLMAPAAGKVKEATTDIQPSICSTIYCSNTTNSHFIMLRLTCSFYNFISLDDYKVKATGITKQIRTLLNYTCAK